jgi:N-acetyl-1-D-myo-inositol-2-amino-2-deoxy-alpha-D-glucopyranoside deacetylase
MGRRLGAVFAHPDDDTYALGGTLALDRGLEYTLVVATSGEAGLIADPVLANPETLAKVREQEERDALAVLGVANATVEFLRHPDGALADVPRRVLVDMVVEPLRRGRPDVVVTFGPEGITKHADHVAIHHAATEAFHRLRADEGKGRAFHRLLYTALPHSDLDRFRNTLRARGMEVGDPDGPFMPRGVPDDTIAVRVDCRRVSDVKLEALRAHRTQQGELDSLPEDLLPEMLGRETFVQAWPPVTDSSGPSLSSVFEGLEA